MPQVKEVLAQHRQVLHMEHYFEAFDNEGAPKARFNAAADRAGGGSRDPFNPLERN